MELKQHFKYWLTCLSIITLVACGGGGGGGGSGSATSLTGTTAVGAPLPYATVTLKDATGKTLTTTADIEGVYTFSDVSGTTAPLMLQATGTAGGTSYTLHSVLTTVPATGVSGVVNITPVTEAITAQALGDDPATVFADKDKIKTIDPIYLALAKARLNAALKDVLSALGQDSSKVDLFTTQFTANGTGLDKLLDLVALNSEATGTGTREIKITDKNTQTTTAIAANVDPSLVTAIDKPAAIDLDTSGIKTLLTQFNVLTVSADNINSDAMKDLFDADYLQEGLNSTQQITSIAANAVGAQFSDYVLNGCDKDTQVCQGQAALKVNGAVETFQLPVKKGADGKWRAYGEQSPFRFEFKPIAFQKNFVGTNAPPSTVDTAVNFWFPGKTGNDSERTYKSAKLYISTTGKSPSAGWGTPFIQLNEKSACSSYDWLPIDVSTDSYNTTNCSNFKVIASGDSIISNFNAAQANGQAWFKLVAYPNADYSGTPKEYVSRATQQMFNTTTATAAIKASGLGIATDELNTNSVSFTGKPNSVNIRTSTLNSSYSGNTSWNGFTNVATLNGKATVAAAKTLCGSSDSCANTYGSNAKINFIHLGTYDRQGRGVWMQWSVATSPGLAQ